MAIVATVVAELATPNAHSREDAQNPEIVTAADAMNTVYAVMRKSANVPPAVVVHADVVITNAVQAAHAE